MLQKVLASLKRFGDDTPDIPARRKYQRRRGDQCVTVIGERMYPLIDWSLGGVQINGDERLFGVNQQMDIVMKFRMNEGVMDIPHTARVVRKSKNKVAFEFLPMSQAVKNKFQSVVDDFVAREFVESQLA